MRLSAEEATALIIALDALVQLPGSPSAMDAARTKLISVLDSEREGFVDVTGLPEGHIYSVLSQAVAEGRSVNLTYASGTTGKITQRQVVPERIESVTGRHLLLGYCYMSSAQRSFRLDRIVEVDLGGYAEVPAAADQIPHEPVLVRCSLSSSAEWIADVHPVEVMDMTPDGRLDVRISVHDPQWIVGLAMSLAGHLEVHEPAYIRDLVVQETRQALTAYARGIQ
jgi:predicted DNA-binding transcriptional regulator YafY